MNLKIENYVKLYIISKKINEKNLDDKGIEDLKVQYYAYMIKYYIHEN